VPVLPSLLASVLSRAGPSVPVLSSLLASVFPVSTRARGLTTDAESQATREAEKQARKSTFFFIELSAQIVDE